MAMTVVSSPVSAGTDLSPHRAVYDLERMKRPGGSDFSRIGGRMVYNLDVTCEGMTYNHRLLMDLVTAQGAQIRSEAILSFYETRDGKSFRFQVREKLNENVVVELEGRATRDATGKTATLTYDKRKGGDGDKLVVLPPGVLFPLQHTADLIRAAVRGEITHNAKTFDGDELSLADSFISSAPPDRTSADVVPAEMASMKSWLTRVAFYKAEGGDAVPYYETQMQFWENGLSGDFTMEAESLSVLARLSEVELFDRPTCD